MRLHHAIFFVLSGLLAPVAQASDVSWIFRPGYYTHSPATGQRVAQYEPERPSIVPTDPTYQESGYRHQTCASWHRLAEPRADLGRGHSNPALWRVGVSLSRRGNAVWSLGQSTRPLDAAFDSWQNSYGMNRQPYGYGAFISGYGASISGYGPGGAGVWQAGPQPLVVPAPMPFSGAPSAPPVAGPMAPQGQEL